jgi:pyruvate/2-oxoglutarate dehydrogenase complex dihydrolipoamide acyltransferase (E2) component
VAVLETAKAASDLEVDRAGRLRRLRRAGEECAFGDILGYLDDVERDAGGAVGGGAVSGGGADEGTDGTAAAARSRVQAAVAATVALSHRTIPAAFCTARVRVDAALEVLDAISERTGAVVDLAALIVKAVAELSPGFPDFFGTVSADGELRRAVHADVGVTVDADNGLFVPVIRDVTHRALDEVADELVLFRLAALEGRFDESVLAGGGITVSLNLVDGVDVVQPLIVPPQVAIVSVGGIGREPRLDPAGGVDDARVAAFGLGYDHRVVNGRAAAGFLARLKALIERPEWTDPAG